MLFERVYHSRSWLASMPGIVIIALAIFWSSQITPLKIKPQLSPPIQLHMVNLPKPEPVVVQAQPVAPAHPEPVKPSPPKIKSVPATAATIPTPSTPTTPTVAPSSNTSNTVVAEQQPRIAKATVEPILPPPPPVPATSASASLESNYIAKLRANIESSKRYPTGREASLMHPIGMVRIWLVLDRNGNLLDSGVEQSSHSMLLDHAALSTVRRGEYARFPAEIWVGEDKHRFTVDINYTPAS